MMEQTVGPTRAGEATFSIIEKQLIGFAVFKHLTVRDEQAVTQPGWNGQFAADHMNIDLAAIANIVGTIIGHVKIERPVAVDIGERERDTAMLTECAGNLADIVEFAMAIVLETEHALPCRGDEQIQETVTIEIGEDGAAIIFIGEDQTGFTCDVFELPVAEIPEKGVRGIETTEENVAQTIVIEITDGDTGTIIKHAVGGAFPLGEDIREPKSGLSRREKRKAGFASRGNIEVGPATAWFGVPMQCCRRQVRRAVGQGETG